MGRVFDKDLDNVVDEILGHMRFLTIKEACYKSETTTRTVTRYCKKHDIDIEDEFYRKYKYEFNPNTYVFMADLPFIYDQLKSGVKVYRLSEYFYKYNLFKFLKDNYGSSIDFLEFIYNNPNEFKRVSNIFKSEEVPFYTGVT